MNLWYCSAVADDLLLWGALLTLLWMFQKTAQQLGMDVSYQQLELTDRKGDTLNVWSVILAFRKHKLISQTP